ncbi:MAG TPA: hypothetical protein VMM92_15285, partial [Thermoanaerobaculia bacterium]|nr:hypothetical protein [Thermoanaerobaculia bacterium]
MSFELAQKIADAVLYEGYVLYPYRASSAKNQVRFQFGVLAPRDHCLGEGQGAESWEMQTECLVEPDPEARVDLKVRCLQLQARTLEEAAGPGAFRPVEFLDLADELLVAWDEGVERELAISGLSLSNLVQEGERRLDFALPGGTEVEELPAQKTPEAPDGELQGRIVRRRWPIAAAVRLSAEPIEGFVRLRVRIENLTPWPAGSPPARDELLRRSLLSTHTLLAIAGGAFVSLLEPPEAARQAAAGCANLRTWPVLVGPEESRDLVLSSPIILYDYPAVAPESQGDLCDATEIDEILTLRIMTLTDEEKREARGTDPRARRIVERADSLPEEIFARLHGAVRSLRPAGSEPADPRMPEGVAEGVGELPIPTWSEPSSAASPGALVGWEDFLNPPG